MELKTAVEKYLQVVKDFRRPMLLSDFGLSKSDVEAMLSAWDEDYHLHRHFELIAPADATPAAGGHPAIYQINGLAYSAILFKESIRHVLG